MSLARLALWLLRRERASGEWRVLLLALVVGVGSVATVGFLGDRIARAMRDEGARFLGADLLVTSPRPVSAWPAHRLDSSAALEFASMIRRDDAFQLATVRAVDAAYPLRGSVRIAGRAFAPGTPQPALPPRGALYADPSLLPLLNATVGDTVQIGEARFRIAGVVAEEPGQLGGVFGFAPRVFLRADEVTATRILQPGSRLTYLYQFAGDAQAIAAFAAALKPTLDDTQRLIGARAGVETLRDGFDKLDTYLHLTALVSLLLAVAAIAIAAHRHALRHYDQAALLRSLGASTAQLRTLHLTQFLLLGLAGSLVGVLLGALLQQGLAGLILPDTFATLPQSGSRPVFIALGSGLAALAGAALPALIRLTRVPPLRVLRRDLPPVPVPAWTSASLSGAVLLALIAAHAGDVRLVAGFVGALAGIAAVLALLARLALVAGRGMQPLARGPLRFGLSQLLRHRFDSTLQLGAFTLALFLVALLALVKSDLVDGWRQQLPPGAPNHFLVNIAPEQQARVGAWLAERKLETSRRYPMIRGRLVERNGQPIADTLPADARDSNTLRRELNLTWTADLPANNRILAGRWHGAQGANEISVESGMAERLHLAVGDTLGFRIGDQTIRAKIGSLRSVKWESMQPNFFVIFPPGDLDALPASYIASVHVPPGTQVMPEFVKAFPGITVLALDTLIARLEAVFARIIATIQWLSGFLLAAGMAVVVATLLASLDARRHEAVLLRTLGAERAWLARGLLAEFAVLGALAGVLATACAELAMMLIAGRLFDLPGRLHPGLWLALPAAGALLVTASGWLTTRHITRVPPMHSIRALG